MAVVAAHAAIQPASGEAVETEVDWVDEGAHSLTFTRRYRSGASLVTGLGTWSHPWSATFSRSG
ncbi:DUF6531 domain-containing protein, partial [Ramlibacter sp.]|uniref:DUF6531 domain-containing protein n=1 Tax=Ramlibacter sp. TaxID=1917967 RepID=UPI003D1297D8